MRWGQHLLGSVLIGFVLALLFELVTGHTLVEVMGGPFIAMGAIGIAVLVIFLLFAWYAVSSD